MFYAFCRGEETILANALDRSAPSSWHIPGGNCDPRDRTTRVPKRQADSPPGETLFFKLRS